LRDEPAPVGDYSSLRTRLTCQLVTSLYCSFIVLFGLAEQGRQPAAAPRGGLLLSPEAPVAPPPPSAGRKSFLSYLPPLIACRREVAQSPRGRSSSSGR
jgi:hypothetical protein